MRVLVVAANPDVDLDLEKEIRGIEEALRGSSSREAATVRSAAAARPSDVVRLVRALNPEVVHFMGHGATGSICFRGDNDDVVVVGANSFGTFLKDRGVKLLVLNSCYSADVAMAALGSVCAVVGTLDEIDDDQAFEFSRVFYSAFGDGLSVGESYRDAVDSLSLSGLQVAHLCEGDTSLVVGDLSRNDFEPARHGAETQRRDELVALMLEAEDEVQTLSMRLLAISAPKPSGESLAEVTREARDVRSMIRRIKTLAGSLSGLSDEDRTLVFAWCDLLAEPGGPALKGDVRQWSQKSNLLKMATEKVVQVVGQAVTST